MELMIVAKVYSPSRGQLIDLALPPGKNLEAGGILEEPGRLSIFLDRAFVEPKVLFLCGLRKPWPLALTWAWVPWCGKRCSPDRGAAEGLGDISPPTPQTTTVSRALRPSTYLGSCQTADSVQQIGWGSPTNQIILWLSRNSTYINVLIISMSHRAGKTIFFNIYLCLFGLCT